MLVLTQREGDSLVIGDTVTLKVLMIKGKQVRIGINAPQEISVRREEATGPEETVDFNDQDWDTETSTGLPGA